jgi:protein ImuB
LFTRAHPTAEQLSTLLARLGALMGQDRIGAPAVVDSDRPGAFAVTPFATDHSSRIGHGTPPAHASGGDDRVSTPLHSALRRCRRPVPARVAADNGRPLRVTSDRHGFAGGQVRASAGPWRTSGEWWHGGGADGAGGAAGVGKAGEARWDRDEWDVALNDGAVYRVFRDREADGWFIDAIVD